MRQVLVSIALAALVLAASDAARANSAPPPAVHSYAGLKKTVAVESFQSGDSTGGATTGEGLAAMLGEALMSDGRFVVVERGAMQAIQTEQALALTGGTTAETSAQHGRLVGASYLIRGTVTKYDPNHGGASFSIAGIGVKNTSTYIELSIRVIDATTGEVVSVVKADGTASAHSLDVSVATKSGAPVSSDAFKNTPLAQAAESAIHKAVGQMDIGLEHAPWSAMVVDAEDNHIVINAGANQNIQVGMKLQAYHKGKVLTDPGTGEVLETNFEPLGTVMVQDVHEKVSTGILVDGAARPAATSCAIEEMTMNRSILVAALVCGAGLVSALARGRADQALRGNAQTATSPT